MKKSIGIFAVLVFLFVSGGIKDAGAALVPYPRDLRLVLDGQELTPGETLNIEPGDTLLIDVYAGDTNKDGVIDVLDFGLISADLSLTVELSPASASANGVLSSFNYGNPGLITDRWGTLSVTADRVVNVVVNYQLVFTSESDEEFSNVFPVLFQTGPVTVLRYLYVPKSMSVRDSQGKPVSNVEITASQTRTYYVWADDYNQDGAIDERDYDVFPVNEINEVATVEVDDESLLMGTSTTPALIGLAPTMLSYPTVIATVRVTARNQGGNQDDEYDPVYTDFVYQIDFDGTTGDDIPLSDVLPFAGIIKTPPVSVRINALDDAGSGDDGGGSCNALGLGALLFLTPLAFFRKKSA